MDITQIIAGETDYLVSARRHLHQNPELSSQEFNTAAYIETQLDSLQIPRRRVGETGVLGVIDGKLGSGKTVLLRADIDALPLEEKNTTPYSSQTAGIMHACGHDVHTAALLGAAKVLQSLNESFAGRVLLVFQPAEEFGHGSKFFLAENIMDGVDRAFGIHVSPNFPVGSVAMVRGACNASCDYFTISIKGKEAHISTPEKGVDALYIASLITAELKTLSGRLVEAPEIALIGVGKLHSGAAFNIIPGEALLEGTTRTFSYETQDLFKKEITELAVKTAELHGGSAEVSFETFASALINDDEAYDEAYRTAGTIVGEENIITDREQVVSLGADDFSEFARGAKGAFVYVGTANSENPATQFPLHSNKFDIDEQSLAIAAALHVKYTLSVLRSVNDYE